MVRPHVGTIEYTAPPSFTFPTARRRVGTYAIDANGRIADTITWNDGDVWDHIPGVPYDLNSPIGPIDNGAKRSRNPAAAVRWNWGLDRIDGPSTVLSDTYEYGNATGAGTTLYNLDSGVMMSHDEFRGRYAVGYSSGCPTGAEKGCTQGWLRGGIVDQTTMARPQGCATHGTHTASTAAGRLYGVASHAEIIPVQALSCDGTGSDLHVLDAMAWALEHVLARSPRVPSVISMSLGSNHRSTILDSMVRKLNDFGILVVCAAGNDAADACTGSPAGAPGALTVGAVGLAEPAVVGGRLVDDETPAVFDLRATFSDDGSCVDLFAPGVDILAAVPSADSTHVTSIMSGTSMAAPMVAGVALQIWGLHPTLKPDDVRRAIYCTSVHGNITGLDPHTRNYMLQGGAQLATTATARMIAEQREPNPQAPFQPHEATYVSRDATECFVPPAPLQQQGTDSEEDSLEAAGEGEAAEEREAAEEGGYMGARASHHALLP